MEKLQGPINPYFLAEQLDREYSLEQDFVTNTESLRFKGEEQEEEQAHYFSLPSLDDTMPFLQMLQSVETPQFLSFQEPNFQTLLKLQQLKKPWDNEHSSSSSMYFREVKPQVQQAVELESCITQLHSPVKSENKDKLLTHQPLSTSSNQEPSNSVQKRSCCRERKNSSGQQKLKNQQPQMGKTPSCETRERKKRKRTRPAKNKEEVENQRMTHIAVERNRRRQMNENLNALRSLMPTSYVQRGDQASIIGGAIDFVKELEQLLQSLETQKRMRRTAEDGSESSSSISMATCEELAAENKTSEAREEVLVTVIHNHVNLKIQCQKRPGQLLKAIVALEDLSLTVLHLNITSSHTSVHYSFNLKIEDDCKLGSADEVVAAVHEIFRYINSS